jgi:hypothetical protein
MDLDARATWGVFCDQILPPELDNAPPADDEEREVREYMRGLVLAYLAGEARPHIARHVTKKDNEDVLVGGLLRVCEVTACNMHGY